MNKFYILGRQYYKFIIPSIGLTAFYMLDKKFGFINKFASKMVIIPALNIVDSKEVKGAGIDLLENLFKDKRVIKSILDALLVVIKEKEFQDPLKVFIKDWVLSVLKHPEFLRTTKISIVQMLKSKEVLSDTTILLKFIADHQVTKDTLAKFFKDLALSNQVFPDLCNLFEKSSIKAITSNRTKHQMSIFSNELYSNKQFKNYLYYKALIPKY